jgi:hypothetical protein
VRAIVDAAAPLTLKDLARRIAATTERKSVTERFLDEVRAMVAKARVFVDADDVVWAKGQDAATWREVRADASREFDDVPMVELCNAARRVLGANLALPREDLARETARAFGVTRLGRVVRERAEVAIERLIAAGEAVADGESVRAV